MSDPKYEVLVTGLDPRTDTFPGSADPVKVRAYSNRCGHAHATQAEAFPCTRRAKYAFARAHSACVPVVSGKLQPDALQARIIDSDELASLINAAGGFIEVIPGIDASKGSRSTSWWMTAKHDGKCASCGGAITKGQRIFWFKNAKQAFCEPCKMAKDGKRKEEKEAVDKAIAAEDVLKKVQEHCAKIESVSELMHGSVKVGDVIKATQLKTGMRFRHKGQDPHTCEFEVMDDAERDGKHLTRIKRLRGPAIGGNTCTRLDSEDILVTFVPGAPEPVVKVGDTIKGAQLKKGMRYTHPDCDGNEFEALADCPSGDCQARSWPDGPAIMSTPRSSDCILTFVPEAKAGAEPEKKEEEMEDPVVVQTGEDPDVAAARHALEQAEKKALARARALEEARARAEAEAKAAQEAKRLEEEAKAAALAAKATKLSGKRAGSYKKVSEVFGINAAWAKKVMVWVYDDKPEGVPAVDPHYLFRKTDLVGLIIGVEVQDRVYIHGPKGAGKSSLAQQFCARTNRVFMKANFHMGITAADLVGSVGAKAGATVWQDGILPQFYSAPEGSIMCLDEFDGCAPELAFLLQRPLEKSDGQLCLLEDSGRLLTLPSRSTFVATGNTNLAGDDTGLYAASTSPQNAAVADRFGCVLRCEYMKETEEADLLVRKCGVSRETAALIARVAAKSRVAAEAGKLSAGISTRQALSWAEKVEYCNIKVAFMLAVGNLSKAEDTRALVEILSLASKEVSVAADDEPDEEAKK